MMLASRPGAPAAGAWAYGDGIAYPSGAALGLLASLPQPAQAQSFLHSIFGYGSSAVSALPLGSSAAPFSPRGPAATNRPSTRRWSAPIAPCACGCATASISRSALPRPQSSFARDADACSASCGSEARLFYHPNAGGDVDSMVDLTGLAYSALPNAFKYRQSLVPELPLPAATVVGRRAASAIAPTRRARAGYPGAASVVTMEPQPAEAHDPGSCHSRRPLREDYPAWPSPRWGNAGAPRSRPYRY